MDIKKGKLKSYSDDSKLIRDLIDYISRIPMTKEIDSDSFGYDNSAKTVIDAVLSINRKYFSFVVPRLEFFCNKFPEITTINQLSTLIDKEGYNHFMEFWNYKHLGRVKTLDLLCKKLVDCSSKFDSERELDRLKLWAETTNVSDCKSFGVQGIGLATFQYLRMMFGVNTVKPDIHIKKAVKEATGQSLGDMKCIFLLEQASKKVGIPSIKVDHNLWRYFAKDVPNEANQLNLF